jgi:GNAT superfamily N-acetyltransferase
MEIAEVIGAGPAFDRWYDVYRVAEESGRPYARPWLHHELLASLTTSSVGERIRVFLGTVDDAAVAAGAVEYSTADNLDAALVGVQVRPERRRRGFGTLMLDHLLDILAELGRTIVTAETSYPYDAPRDGSGSAGAEFLRSCGFKFGLGDIQRVLDVRTAAAIVPDLLAEVAPAYADYRLVPFSGPVPDDFVASYAALVASLPSEVPSGELTVHQRSADVEVLRASEELLRRQRRRSIRTVALDGNGDVAGYTSIVVPGDESRIAYQWGTLVAREHRGHRLGLALKAANLELLVREEPAVDTLVTYNAQVNDHMVAINDRFGFRPVERLGEFERRL